MTVWVLGWDSISAEIGPSVTEVFKIETDSGIQPFLIHTKGMISI